MNKPGIKLKFIRNYNLKEKLAKYEKEICVCWLLDVGG